MVTIKWTIVSLVEVNFLENLYQPQTIKKEFTVSLDKNKYSWDRLAWHSINFMPQYQIVYQHLLHIGQLSSSKIFKEHLIIRMTMNLNQNKK